MDNKNVLTKKKMLLNFFVGAKLYFVLAVIFACLSSLANMVQPKIIEYTVDGVLGNDTENFPAFLIDFLNAHGGTGYIADHLWITAIAVIVSALLAVSLKYIYEMSVVKGGEQFVKNMRDQLYEHIEHLSVDWHTSHATGDIIQRCTSDVESIKMFLSDQLVNLFSMIVTIAMTLCFMFRIEWRLALISLCSVPVIVGISIWFHGGIGRSFKVCDENEGILSSIAQENFTGVRVVRAFGKEKAEQDKFDVQNHIVTSHWVKLGAYFTVYFFVADLLSGVLLMIVLCAGTVMCVHGTLTVGSLIAVITYVGMMMRPVRMMGRIVSEMSKTGVSVNRVYEVISAPMENDKADAIKAPLDKDIVFDHVSFAYPVHEVEELGLTEKEKAEAALNREELKENPEVLKDISFTIPAGTTLGILGTTGSGKSTMMQLLTRFFDLPAENGKITIGGVDIQDMPAHWIRENIGYVMQEPYLFSKTIAENIAITQDEPDDAAVKKAADMAALTSAVEKFQNGYETFVGERGVTLSGGQKQRTAIARALTLNTPILIFDDSLSAVDTQTDAIIRKNLKNYMGKATVIIISHRITTLMAADQILVLKDGEMVDIGTHDELKNKDGLYKTICDIQMGSQDNGEEVSVNE